ncbi:MAG TPA: CPBP family intramembrane glutamic endopeptidase [Verrucomicrobiae bacterium]|nr:CPBP family intramembrane glutamic endopeptidase [Verrucomicrobiae bacterium]
MLLSGAGQWRQLLAYRDVWIFTFALVVVLPLLGYLRFRQFVAAGARELSAARKFGLYGRIATTQWLLVVAMLLIARRHGLSMADVGQQVNNPPLTLLATGGLLLILAVVVIALLRRIRRSKQEKLEGAMGRVAMMAPASGGEFAAFSIVCLTAGICEELLFRGWLVSLLWTATGSVWAAVGIGGVLFGAGHAYQGPRGMLRTGFIGLQLGLLFVATGSLIPGQVLHAGVDLLAGAAGVAIASRRKTA